jgi:hypothetical protein
MRRTNDLRRQNNPYLSSKLALVLEGVSMAGNDLTNQ